MIWSIIYILGTGITIGIFANYSGMDDPLFVFAGMFWPIALPAMVAYKITKMISKVSYEKEKDREEQKRLLAIENNFREQEIRKALKELNSSL